MSDTPPPAQPHPSRFDQAGEPAPAGKLRAVTILVMILSIIGLIGTGFCAVAVIADGTMGGGAIWALLIVAPFALFFVGAIWVCSELLKRLRT